MRLPSKFVKKAPIIFGVISVVLTGVTVYETAKAAVKIDRKIERMREHAYAETGSSELDRREVVRECLPDAVPAIMSAAGLVASIITGNMIAYKYQLELIGIMSAAKEGYRAYSNHVREQSREVDQEARERAFKERTEASLSGYSGKMLWFDEWSGRSFERDVEDVVTAEYKLNKTFILKGHATLNEFYEFLGLPPVHDGDALGWGEYQEPFWGYKWVDFMHVPKRDSKDDYMELSFPFPPVLDFKGEHEY